MLDGIQKSKEFDMMRCTNDMINTSKVKVNSILPITPRSTNTAEQYTKPGNGKHLAGHALTVGR